MEVALDGFCSLFLNFLLLLLHGVDANIIAALVIQVLLIRFSSLLLFGYYLLLI